MTADCVIFGFDGEALKVLLIERGLEPYLGSWALPGGFMRIDETIESCAMRELAEETGLTGVYLEQFKVYSTVKRDPRERVVTVAFIALVRPAMYVLTAGDDASDARWFDVEFLPPMAFDHTSIIKEARQHLSEILKMKPVAFELLNKTFSLGELQNVYEAISGHSYDRRNFQRKALQSGLLTEVPESEVIIRNENCCEPMAEYMSCDECNSHEEPSVEKMRKTRVRPKPGRPRKFFSLLKRKSIEQREEKDGEASIKDLFNF